MTIYLLDVNVLIALIDPAHVRHDDAHNWLASQGKGAGWATCPLTENGALRIVGHPRYANSPGTPAAVVPALKSLRALPGHVFWADDLSLLDTQRINLSLLSSSNQITDSYLLALASAHGEKLATFDRRLVVDSVVGGAKALHLLG